LNVAVDFCSSASWFSKDFSAYVASDFIDYVAEELLFVAAFLAFNPQEEASGFWDKFVPIRHVLFFSFC